MISSGSDPIYPNRRGAISPYVYGLSKNMSEKGIFVTVLGVGQGKLRTGKLTIKSVNNGQLIRSFTKSIDNSPIYPPNILFSFNIAKELLNLHKFFNIDIIHSHNAYSIANIASVLGIPVVCSIHNEIRYSFSLALCNKILPVSEYLGSLLIEQKKVNPNKVNVLPVAIDTSEYKPQKKIEAKKKLKLQKFNLLLFVGRKCPQKGPQIFIEALPKILEKFPETIAILVGPDYFFGSDSKAYTNVLRDLAISLAVEKKVIFLSFIDDETLRTYYSAADVVVCPSIWQEPLGKVVLEALAFEKPVVASRVGGIPEIITDNKNGLLISPNNPSTLADHVVYLLDNETFSSELGRQGRLIVEEKYSFEPVSRSCIKVYRELFNKRAFK